MVPPIDIAQIRYSIVATWKFAHVVRDQEIIQTHPYTVIEYVKRKTFNTFLTEHPKPIMLRNFRSAFKAQKYIDNLQHATNRKAIETLIEYVFYNPHLIVEFGLCVFHESLPVTPITLELELMYKNEYVNASPSLSYADIKDIVVRYFYALYNYYNTMFSFTYVDSMESLYKFLFI